MKLKPCRRSGSADGRPPAISGSVRPPDDRRFAPVLKKYALATSARRIIIISFQNRHLGHAGKVSCPSSSGVSVDCRCQVIEYERAVACRQRDAVPDASWTCKKVPVRVLKRLQLRTVQPIIERIPAGSVGGLIWTTATDDSRIEKGQQIPELAMKAHVAALGSYPSCRRAGPVKAAS